MRMDPREQHGIGIGIGIATAGQGPAVVVIRDLGSANFSSFFFSPALLRKCGISVRITEWSGPLWPVEMDLILDRIMKSLLAMWMASSTSKEVRAGLNWTEWICKASPWRKQAI